MCSLILVGYLVASAVINVSVTSFDRFYAHDQALDAIFQSQGVVLGDNLLKVSGIVWSKVNWRLKYRC